jgi:Spy/CpxP family protein refolding chaperone
MKTRSLITSLIAGSLVLGSSVAVFAGQKGNCDRDSRQEQRAEKRLERMTEKLALTPDQQAAIKTLWQQQTRPERSAMARNGLQGLDPNADNYDRQVQQHIEQAQQQMAKHMQARADHKAALYDILTPEQEQKLEQMRDRSDRNKGMWYHGRGAE